jgi:hypothetical protein
VSGFLDDGDADKFLGRKINRDLSDLMRLYSRKKSLPDKDEAEAKDASKPSSPTRSGSRPSGDDDDKGADPNDDDAVLHVRDMNAVIEALGDSLRKRFAEMKEEIADLKKEMVATVGKMVGKLLSGELESQLGSKINLIVADQEKRKDDLFAQLRDMIASTKPPDVHVSLPPESIKVLAEVKQLPSEVTVNLPEGAIKLESKSLLDAAVRRRTTIKNIEYDPGSGRPLRIVEESE